MQCAFIYYKLIKNNMDILFMGCKIGQSDERRNDDDEVHDI